MANWAKDFMDRDVLSSRPVTEKLRNGLKFDLGSNRSAYVLQVQPVHYRDTAGDMVAIDTALRADGNGLFGAPGLPFRVSEDGRIRIGSFQSHIPLIGAGRGQVDGSRLIREFPGGQEVFELRERGIKHDIILDRRPTNDFAVSVVRSGSLPVGYLELPIVCEDAGGSLFTVGGDSLEALSRWLEAATYPVVIDPTYTLQPDATDGLDTSIKSGSAANTNYETEAHIQIGTTSSITRRQLLKFDLSSIVASDVCDSAVLHEWLLDDTSVNSTTANVYRQLRDWVEAQATWNIWKTSNNWATAGGFNAADCEQTEIGSLIIGADPAPGSEFQWTLTASEIQEMYDGSFTNNGFMVRAVAESANMYRFNSSDYGTAGERPKLVVNTTSVDLGASPVFFF